MRKMPSPTASAELLRELRSLSEKIKKNVLSHLLKKMASREQWREQLRDQKKLGYPTQRVARGSWYIPIARPHELPIAPYPLWRSPALFYTARPSYLNMIANDPDNPLHYMAKRDGSRFIG
jgi:hypothetical protein